MKQRLQKPGRLGALLVVASALSLPSVATAAQTSATMPKQIKTLKQQAAALTAKLSGLQAKASALEAEGPPAPSLSGPAGGDLTGSYPNPQLRTDAIGTSQLSDGAILGRHLVPNALSGTHLADSSIGSAELTSGLSIGQSELAPGNVGAGQLLDAFVVRQEEGVFLRSAGETSVEIPSLDCPPGTRVIAADLEQDPTSPPKDLDDIVATKSAPDPDNPDRGWEITVWANKSDVIEPFPIPVSDLRVVFVNLLCLREAS